MSRFLLVGNTIRNKLLMSALVVGMLGSVTGMTTWSAFTATTDNPGNSFQSGTVVLTDNDGGSTPMLTLNAAKPGDNDTGCIQVTYSGSLPTTVKLYGTTTGTGLDQYLDVTVTRGTVASGAFDSCAGFTPDATNYAGQGPGVIYSGTLQGFPDAYGGGITDPAVSGGTEVWNNPETHAYRISVTLQDNNSAQGKSANQTFTWESRNN